MHYYNFNPSDFNAVINQALADKVALDAEDFVRATQASNKELNEQLELMGKRNDYAREMAKIEQEHHAKLAVYHDMARVNPSAYADIVNAQNQNTQMRKDVVTHQHFQNLQTGFSDMALEKETTEQALQRIKDEYMEKLAIIQAEEARIGEFTQATIDARLAAYQEWKDKETDIERKAYDEKLQIYSQGLNLVSGVWDQMTDIVKDAYGEQSKAAKIMFGIQKAIAIAQAIINTEAAANKALEQGGAIFGIPMATAVRAMGYASVGLMASQAIAHVAGFRTGGYTGNVGLNDVAGVVHGQEYVLNANATKRLGKNNLDRLNNGGSIGTAGNQINITVNVDANGNSQTQGAEVFGKRMADGVKATVIDFLRQERRQGGFLYGT